MTAADLSDGDHQRLNGGVLQVLQKGSHSRDELLAELHELVARLPTQTSGMRSGSMVKILYVEDNEDNVYMLRRRLERHGFEVVVAA